MTQTELAEKSGVTQAFISLVLSGNRRPNYATAKTWQTITGIEIDFWMTAESDALRARFDAAQSQKKAAA